jgi:hypothetical protein
LFRSQQITLDTNRTAMRGVSGLTSRGPHARTTIAPSESIGRVCRIDAEPISDRSSDAGRIGPKTSCYKQA